ncbi:hypothetical protein LEMLEM_LOCUS10297 [Lemmus lemmus]
MNLKAQTLPSELVLSWIMCHQSGRKWNLDEVSDYIVLKKR